MAQYSALERHFSTFVKKAPKLHAAAKFTYQGLNYLIHKDKNFSFELAPGVKLETPSSLIGAKEPLSGTAEFFGYFDASPWSPDGRYYVVNQIGFGKVEADVIIYDFQERERYSVGSSPAWTWQQATMARWLSNENDNFLLFNAVVDNVLGTKIITPDGKVDRFIEYPLQALNSSKGKFYSLNYLRLNANGTEYGYHLDVSNMRADQPLDADGIWQVDFVTGASRLIISLDELLAIQPRSNMAGMLHEINHISVSPDGLQFVFVHRYRGSSGQFSRLYCADHQGDNLELILDDNMVSHYCWVSSSELLVWARTNDFGIRYYLINTDNMKVIPFENDNANQWGDGHPTYNSDADLVVTDSYPDRKRQQHLFTINLKSKETQNIATLYSPMKFALNKKRVDLHPRWSPNSKSISIDASFNNERRNYILCLER